MEPNSDWKSQLSKEERSQNVDKMVAVFTSMKKHSHLSSDQIRKLCKDFENEKVFQRASSRDDNFERIETKMAKVLSEKDEPTPKASAVPRPSSTPPTWKLESNKLKDLPKASLFKNSTSTPPNLQKVFQESLQSWAGSFFLNQTKHAPKASRSGAM